MGWWMKCAGYGSGVPYLLSLYSGGTRTADLRLTATNKLSLAVATTIQANTGNNYFPDATYRHYSINIKIHSSAGWFNVYCDGALLLSFSGNTGNADLTSLTLGNDSTQNLINYTYWDDIYIDDTTGEPAATRSPAYQFQVLTPNGNGSNSGMTGFDAPHNSDTDYVQALAAGLKDTYAMTTVSPPASTAFSAVIPFAFARKPGVEDVQLRLLLRSGASELLSPAQALTTGYTMLIGDRTTLDPNTGLAWTQAGIDALEAGAQSAGTFA
jgi:hypothetical protein